LSFSHQIQSSIQATLTITSPAHHAGGAGERDTVPLGGTISHSRVLVKLFIVTVICEAHGYCEHFTKTCPTYSCLFTFTAYHKLICKIIAKIKSIYFFMFLF
jgi:hypothetical protein